MENDGQWFTGEQAKEHAAEFCRRHPKWKMVCDLADGELDRLHVGWNDLLPRDRAPFEGRGGESIWMEFGRWHPMWHRWGHVSGAGVFYGNIVHCPFGHNTMMVVQIGGKRGRYYIGGFDVRPGQRFPRVAKLKKRPRISST